MSQVTKTTNKGKFQYFFNGELYRTSKREFKYACIATTNKAKGAIRDGYEFVLSLGNNRQSTYNSMAQYYRHCDLRVVEIQ